MRGLRKGGALVGLAALTGVMAGCPLAVTDDYTIVDDPAASSSSDAASSGASGEPVDDSCGEGFECAPAVVEGSMARVELSAAAACPPGWGSPSAYSDGTNPGCPCACSAAANGACKPGKVVEFESAFCAEGENKKDHAVDAMNGCVDVYTGASGLRIEAPSATPGTCGVSDPKPAPLSMQACSLAEPATKSCGVGRVCVPALGAPSAKLCNVLPPGAECAPGYAPEKTIYRVSEDTRACECSCGPASPATCVGASADLHSGKNCSESLNASLPAGGACGDAAAFDALGSVKINTGTWVGGQCEAVEKPSGNIKLDTLAAFTLCCAAE